MIFSRNFFVSPSSPIRQAMAHIDANAKGIALVVTDDKVLVGTVTDGDIRRAILHGLDLDRPVSILLDRLREAGTRPVTAPVGTSDRELLALMNRLEIRHVPLVDADGHVQDIAVQSDLVKSWDAPARAMIMAGGYGKRLHPLTEDVPKPMLPVGNRPILERIIRQLSDAGIRRVNLATHYKADVIADHFGDGREFNVDIDYVNEHEPLGTAGALSLIKQSAEPLLVMNGDIVTELDFRALADFHQDNRADMTVVVCPYETRVPYGLIETRGIDVVGISEKPQIKGFVLAGIYLLNPRVCGFVPVGKPYDMTDLIARVIGDGGRVVSFPLREYWLDVGVREDYQQAVSDYQQRG